VVRDIDQRVAECGPQPLRGLDTDDQAARADVVKRGARRWYLIEIRKPCNTYPDKIRIAHDQELQGEICRADPSEPQGPEGFPGKSRQVARRKLIMVDAAAFLEALNSPPGNRLEALKGDLAGKHSIRINDQWRVVFRWTDAGPEDVEIIDYH
jgi:proteic killer suppression protein